MKSVIFNFIKCKWIFVGLLGLIILIDPAICNAQNFLDGPQKIVIDAKRNRWPGTNAEKRCEQTIETDWK